MADGQLAAPVGTRALSVREAEVVTLVGAAAKDLEARGGEPF